MLTSNDLDMIIAAVITVTGGTATVLYGLQKLGLMKIKPKYDDKVVPYGSPCEAHKEIVSLIRELRETQIANLQRHENHRRDLERGERDFVSLNAQYASLREGLGILMDRTGGRPTHWRES
jgi:hypothetical protein